jgi:hypothetical protein
VANEAFARVKIDQLLLDTDWKLTDGRSVRFEYPLDDGGKADYALFDRQGRALAVLEAKSTSVNLSSGEAQGRLYADRLCVPFIFLSNGEEVWFCDKEQDAHFRRVETVFSQGDLIRRNAARSIRRNPLDIPIDRRIAGGGGRLYQIACIDTLCREMINRRRKMLVEMATGTGKTRMAAALLNRAAQRTVDTTIFGGKSPADLLQIQGRRIPRTTLDCRFGSRKRRRLAQESPRCLARLSSPRVPIVCAAACDSGGPLRPFPGPAAPRVSHSYGGASFPEIPLRVAFSSLRL